MPSQTYYHLKSIDYPVAFPVALDNSPVLIQKHTYIDDWIFNRMFAMVQSIQQFLIDNKARLEY